jgi:hypothetical protein
MPSDENVSAYSSRNLASCRSPASGSPYTRSAWRDWLRDHRVLLSAPQMTPGDRSLRATMNDLAQQTGGEAIVGANDLAGAILQQVEDGSNYYTVDPTRLSKPEAVGDFGLRGSVRPVLTGGFAVTVAQVSASSKDVERSRDAFCGASSERIAAAAAQVVANSAGVRSSSAECGRWWL